MSSTPVSSDTLAVSVDRVTQRFSLRHEKTLKGLLVNSVMRRHPNKETFLALDDISLQIPAGSTVGLIGHNGSGKSTLLKIIGGVLTPTTGQVTRRGRLAALLELGAGFHRDLSGRDNVVLNAELLGLSKSQIAEKFDDIVDFSGIAQFIDTPMKFYSSGMFVRLGFSVAVHTEPDVLLIDEVMAVGDEQFQAKCLGVIRQFQADGRTIILVTHGMSQIEEFCDQAVLLHHGQMRSVGEPKPVIAAFRELVAQDQQRAREAKAAHTPLVITPDRPKARIDEVEVRTASGGPLSDFTSGDSLIVDVTFASDKPVEAFVGRVGLHSGGTLLHGTSTARLGVGVQPLDGEKSVRFTLADVRLSGGTYRVSAAVGPDEAGLAWHMVPSAAEVVVAADATRAGPLAVVPSATILAPRRPSGAVGE